MHRLQIHLIVHNKGASPTTLPSYIRVRAIMPAYGRGQADGHPQTPRHTDIHTQTRVTTIHFASSTTHLKCNKPKTVCNFVTECFRLATCSAVGLLEACYKLDIVIIFDSSRLHTILYFPLTERLNTVGYICRFQHSFTNNNNNNFTFI